MRRRDRGDERGDGIPLAVEVALVDERHLARERRHVREQVRNRDREAEVDERLRDLAVADAERSVARHPGEHSSPGIDDAEVMDARDVDAVVDGRDEFVHRLRLAARERERKRHRAVRLEADRRRMSRSLHVSTRTLRAAPVPDDAARDALLDERHALPGMPSKSNAFGRPRGSSESSQRLTFSSNTRSPTRPVR